MLLLSIRPIVPGGIVCFFPSYDYEKQIYSHWESHGVLTRLGHRKNIFREPRKTNQVDQVLRQYSATIEVRENRIAFFHLKLNCSVLPFLVHWLLSIEFPLFILQYMVTACSADFIYMHFLLINRKWTEMFTDYLNVFDWKRKISFMTT